MASGQYPKGAKASASAAPAASAVISLNALDRV
jgi:hypothetical protein